MYFQCIIFRELKTGTPIYDAKNKKMGYSKVAAQHGIAQVTLSRILMAAPGMGKNKQFYYYNT